MNRTWLRDLPQVRLTVLKNAGHNAWIDAPKEFDQALSKAMTWLTLRATKTLTMNQTVRVDGDLWIPRLYLSMAGKHLHPCETAFHPSAARPGARLSIRPGSLNGR